MSSVVCKICNQEIKEDNLRHWHSEHKITMANYFYKYYDKRDKLTGEKIPFKNIDSYLHTDFITKINLKKYLNTLNTQEKQEYLKELLIRRKILKNLIYTPTQFELRSTDGMVGISNYNNTFKQGYYKLCKELGFKDRNFYNLSEDSILKPARSLRGNPFIIDSREQEYLSWGKKEILINKLEIGDYSIQKDNFGIHIERKELSDLINTMSKGYERFLRELERTVEQNLYLILLCESPINDFLSFNYLPWLSKKIQASPSFIGYRIRELLQLFPNHFQIGFCRNRTNMKEVIIKIFEMEDYWKFHDLSLAIDLKLFDNKIL